MGRGWTVAVVAALLLGSCRTAAYLSDTYVGVVPQIVTTGCRDAYEIYDKREAGKLLVVSHLFRERPDCGGPGKVALDAEGARKARFREAADTYLGEIRRGGCRILESAALSSLHYEYLYTCPAAPGPVASPAPLPIR